jgi:hypothetical protein
MRVYEDIEAAQRFLADVVQFKQSRLVRDASGRPFHAEVYACATGGLVVLVDDVDSHYRYAKNAGATIDSPLMDQPYGEREYGARDPEGNLWDFANATNVNEFNPRTLSSLHMISGLTSPTYVISWIKGRMKPDLGSVSGGQFNRHLSGV